MRRQLPGWLLPAALLPTGCVVYSEAPAWAPAPVRACPQVVCPPAGFATPPPPPAAAPVELEPVAPAPPPPKAEVGAPEVAVPALTPAAPDTPPPPTPTPARPMARRRSPSAN